MSFNANSRSVMHLFRQPEYIKYKIPKYQRAYSWTEEEVNAFCDDLLRVIEQEIQDYFWGAIITIKDNNDENIQEVVDGQQRITTFTILIAQLYNLCEEVLFEIDKQKSEGATKNKLKYKKLEERLNEKKSDLGQCIRYKEEYKLTLSEVDKEYFKSMMDISNEAKLRMFSELIIEEIQDKDSIQSSEDDIKVYKSNLKKNILEMDKIPFNLIYKDFKDIYIKKYNINDQYTKINTERQLLYKYINDRVGINRIRSYIGEEILEEEYIKNIIKFLTSHEENDNVDSHKNLKKSWELIRSRIIKSIININDLDTKCEKLISIIDTFINNTHVVAISADKEENAYTMFQVLNDRGRALGTIELLRPYTLQRLEGDDVYMKEAAIYWDKISEDDDCENYLKNYLSSYMHVPEREKKLHNKYKDYFFRDDFSKDQIFDNIKKIYNMKKIYKKLTEGEWPYEDSQTDKWNKNRLYQIIKLLEYKKTIPLLIAIFEVNNSEEDFIYAINIIEKVVFRYITICDKRATKVTKVYSDIISQIRKDGSFPRDIFKLRMKELLKEEGCELDTFKQKIDNKKMIYGNNKNNKIIKYFLSTIEYYYSDYKNNKSKNILDKPSKSFIINDNVVEIEHIYAQNIKVKQNDMEPIKHNIGNLTLLEKEDNIRASNKNFVDKKAGYNDEEHIIITKELNNLSKWDLTEYNNRLDFYRDIASKIYTIE